MQAFRLPLVLVLVIVVAGTAAAQTPAQTEAAIAPAFEKRLADQLATEGIVLSRRNLSLMVEELADKWLVSLVDLTTGRVAASTKIDRPPVDREAAVVVMIHVVADLEAQVVNRRAPPQRSPPVAVQQPSDPQSTEDRAERALRQAAEPEFKRQSLRFGASYDTGAQPGTANGHQRWLVFRGAVDEELDPPAFYRLVGRDDLARTYHRRRAVMTVGYVVGGLAFAVAGVLTIIPPNFQACSSVERSAFDRCVADHGRSLVPIVVAAGVGLAGAAVGTYLYRNPQPIDENDARALADAYNQQLRRQLGLPVAIDRPLLYDVALRSYVAHHDAGLILGGRF